MIFIWLTFHIFTSISTYSPRKGDEMKRKRVKVDGRACYHVMNRVHGKAFLFDDQCREQFVHLLREVEHFTGVEVLTYCVMTNHFHVLLKVHEAKPLLDSELLARYERISAKMTFAQFKDMWDRFTEQKNESGLETLRKRLTARMDDVSWFMFELKSRFTRWYNTTHGLQGGGTFWTDRFKSVMVESGENTLTTMAAYIDLNPVRAGMVKDPKDYRWCGYAAALAGNVLAQQGLRTIMWQAVIGRKGVDVCAVYRVLLFGTALKGRSGAITVEEIREVFAKEGMVPPWELCAHRVRWFGEGLIIGGKEFVSEYSRRWNEALQVKRRKSHQSDPNTCGWCMLKTGND
jgi:putative transposase